MGRPASERETITLSAKVDSKLAKALHVFAAKEDAYVYEVIEQFIQEGLEQRGTSVQKLLAT